MKIVSGLIQGSDAWLEFRKSRFTASEAAAIFGEHKYMTRDELLHQKATGEIAEVSTAQQRLYDKGHSSEAAARHIAEKIIGDDLFPVTVEDDQGALAASMDGLTMIGSEGWEHKLYSEKLAAHVRDVKAGICELDNHYRHQMDQQMLVSGAEKILFMCSDGTEENCEHVWYLRDEARLARLTDAWLQFEKDLAAYVPPERKVEVVAAVQATLPAPWAEVKGEITTTDNLKQFGQALTAYVANINLKPKTDQEFADLDAAVKTLKGAEEKLTQCEEMALAKLDSVAVLRGLINDYRETARQARLIGEKAVKAEKENRKNAIIQQAQDDLRAELDAANKEFSPVVITGISADFYGVTKGLKSIDSMQSKCNDELAMAKIALNKKRDHVRAAIKTINDTGSEYRSLFNDIQQLVEKPLEHLTLIVEKRVADHKAAENARIEREAQVRAERMREEERKREAAEAKTKADSEAAEQSKRDADSKTKADAENVQPVVEPEPQPTYAPNPVGVERHKMPDARPAPTLATSQPAPQTIKAERPSDAEIIETLALKYRVHESKVIAWLIDMDLDEASEHMAANL